MAEIFAYYIT